MLSWNNVSGHPKGFHWSDSDGNILYEKRTLGVGERDTFLWVKIPEGTVPYLNVENNTRSNNSQVANFKITTEADEGDTMGTAPEIATRGDSVKGKLTSESENDHDLFQFKTGRVDKGYTVVMKNASYENGIFYYRVLDSDGIPVTGWLDSDGS